MVQMAPQDLKVLRGLLAQQAQLELQDLKGYKALQGPTGGAQGIAGYWCSG
jgi:hypothetical protein